jgi:putative tryptophan/tyrosine transport system substrate-binding protein
MMDRRTFIGVVAGGILAAPLGAVAQPVGKAIRIGRLSPLSAEADMPLLAAFRRGMRDLGWVERENFFIETRYADGNPNRLSEIAAELVRQRVDVILVGSNPGALAAKNAAGAIPIVMVTTADPVSGGLVASLARPSGNLTGVTALGQGLSAKRLELLKEAVPGVTRVAVLTNPASPNTEAFVKESAVIGRALGIQLQLVGAHDASEFETAFATMASKHAGGLMVLADVTFITHRKRIVELAAMSRIPAVYGEREFVDAGGLMFYGASLIDMYRRAAVYVDKILKGTKPADLPVEQPTKFELIINLKTAKALGLTIPQPLLLRADEVIQ